MYRIVANAVVFLLIFMTVTTAFSQENQERTINPRALITPAIASVYPVAPNNFQGMNSTLLLTTLSQQGNYLVCRGLPESADACVPLEGLPQGVSSHTMQELGVPDSGAEFLIILATDAETQGIGSLVVQTQAGGLSFAPDLQVPLPSQSEVQPQPSP